MRQRCLGARVLTLLVMQLVMFRTGLCDYDSDFCKNIVKQDQTAQSSNPHFDKDYQTTAERIVLVDNNGNSEVNTTELIDVRYSTSNKKVYVQDFKPSTSYWFHVDADKNECLYDKAGTACQRQDDTCSSVNKVASYITLDGDSVNIATAANSMNWPSDIKTHTKSDSPVEERSIQAFRHTTCTWDDNIKDTVVSQWSVLDTSSYSDVDNVVVSAKHHYKNRGTVERIDYTDYKLLKSDILVPESSCKSVQSSSIDTDIPEPTLSFSYMMEIDDTDTSFRAYQRTSTYHEYNYNAQFSLIITTYSTNNSMEKEVDWDLTDYTTNHQYLIDKTTGYCEVKPLTKLADKKDMKLPKEYWGIYSDTKTTHMGQYNVRDIPVNNWLFEFPGNDHGYGSDSRVELYLATDDWIKSQGREKSPFFPIFMEIKTPSSGQFMHIYEFKDKPGYDVYNVGNCFMREDRVSGRFVVKASYDSDVKPKEDSFTYELRKLLKKATGIKSNLRLPDVYSYRGDNYEETTVSFSIYGRYIGYDDTLEDFYDPDPVKNTEAIEKIRIAIDNGTDTIKLDGSLKSISFKKGSLEVYNSNSGFFRYVDSNGGQKYSSGAMAGLGISLLLVSLALGIGGVFAYVRFFRKAAPGISLDMSAMDQKP